jgi:predicted nucleic acid-binding protein
VVPFRLDESAAAIRTLMKRYASVAMDLADACLVQLATVLNIGDVLTLDDDFHVYRFGRARAFRLLPERA